MLAIAIYHGNQLRQGHVALARNLLQAFPERIFKADTRLVPCNNNRALENEDRFDGFNIWPAPGSEDTELGVLMESEVGHGETEVYARVQA